MSLAIVTFKIRNCLILFMNLKEKDWEIPLVCTGVPFADTQSKQRYTIVSTAETCNISIADFCS